MLPESYVTKAMHFCCYQGLLQRLPCVTRLLVWPDEMRDLRLPAAHSINDDRKMIAAVDVEESRFPATGTKGKLGGRAGSCTEWSWQSEDTSKLTSITFLLHAQSNHRSCTGTACDSMFAMTVMLQANRIIRQQ